MDDLPASGSNPSSIRHPSRLLEILTDYGAWEWNIVSGEVQWFGIHGRSSGSWHGQDNDHIQSFTDILHPDDRARVWQKLNSTMARRDIPYADEYRFMHPDGSVRWISGTGRFYYDEAGKPVRMTGIVQDITQRKQAHEALRASEEQFAKAFRTSPHPIGITELATGRCIEVNDACLQLFGFRREEVIGRTTLTLGIWPNHEDRARLVERLQAGEPVRNLELSFQTKSGDLRHILVSSDLAELNGALCLITVGNDITERKQTEAKLHESEERLRLAQSAADIGTFDWDIRTRTIVWSPETERIWGLPVGGFDGTYEHWWRQVHPDDAAEAERIIHLSLENPDIPHKYEHRIIRPDGTVRWIHANATTRRDTAGRPIRMVGVNFDITGRKEAEARLRESEARFRNVFQHAGTGIAIVNLYSGSAQCNPAYCAMLGYTEDELRHVDFSQLVHPDDRHVNLARTKRLLTEELPYFEIENRYVHKNGEPVWVHKVVSLLRDHERRPKFLVALATDITGRKQAEQALRQSELRFRTLLERIGDVFWIADPAQKKFVYASHTFKEVWGRDLPQLYDHFGTWLEAIHEEDREQVKRDFYASMYLGRYDSEYRVVRPDGTIRWIRDHGKPLSIGNLVAGVAEDITERKEREAKLRESEERFRNVFEHAGTGIAIADLDGCLVQCNPAFCAMLGYTEDELRHVHFSKLVHQEDRDANLAQSLRLIAEGPPNYEIENRYIHKNGEPVWVRKFISLMHDDERRAKYVLVLVTDITAQRKAQHRMEQWTVELEEAVNEKTAELVQSQERLRALASELSLAEQRERKRLATELHDHLQQMLVCGKMAIGEVQRVAAGNPDCGRLLERVDDMLSEALTYSRTLVAELSPPLLQDHGLGAGLKWLGEYMRRHGQTVTVLVPENHEFKLPEAHRVLLFQSVRELLINASKHAGTGKASVRLERRDENLHVTVSDEGKGFDRTADKLGTAEIPSGGISSKFGLYSIQERMRALGGSFVIQSAPGLGTTATLILPLASNARDNSMSSELSGAAVVREAAELDSLTKERSMVQVLLVDDHAMVRQGLRSVLDAYDDLHVVAEARDGAEAVKLVEDLHPRVVVMDINMPRMNGIDATTYIKNHWPETTVIGISVNTGDENSDAMKRAGAATVLPKDTAVDQLHDAIVSADKLTSPH